MIDDDLYRQPVPVYESFPLDDDEEIPPEARECKHDWRSINHPDYSKECRYCGKVWAPTNWHE